MRAVEAKLVDFLRNSQQFVIPIYQRTYSWGEEECAQLWNDIIRTGKNTGLSSHFIGSVMYIEHGLYNVTGHNQLMVIDGQQRLTTITILLEAMARVFGDREPIEGFSARKIRDFYLSDPREEGAKRYKLMLSQTDRDTLWSLLDQKELPPSHSVKVKNNFDYFLEKVKETDEDGIMDELCLGISKLTIVDVSLDRAQDNAQLIFESMNSTGKELSQADLIRNYLLMNLEPEQQTRLYEHYWRPIEVDFGQAAYEENFDGFMRHFLAKERFMPLSRDMPWKPE